MGIKVANNANATLAASITNSATSITVTAGQGARFPTLSAGDYFYATLIDVSNNLEIVKVTARSTDVLTVVRAQESTTARAYSTGDRIELRLTAQTFVDATTVTPASVSDQANSSTGYFDLPSGSTAQRPGSPNSGNIRYNSDLGVLEYYDGTNWTSIRPAYNIDYLVVAGGGGGGGYNGGGGGGAGGYRTGTSATVNPNTAYAVTIGAGGAGGTNSGSTTDGGSTGSDSSFAGLTTGTVTSNGGGGGGGAANTGSYQAPKTGGSGGGATGNTTMVANSGAAGTSGQGSSGGSGYHYGGYHISGGGGGGASATGGNGSQTTTGQGGNGGAGSTWSNGSTYAGGGGGGVHSIGGTGGTGGSGGGGNGGTLSSYSGTAGTANTGGGGGGSGNAGYGPQAGGSGVVIIRYVGSQKGSGGTVTSAGGYTYHTFTSSGTFTA